MFVAKLLYCCTKYQYFWNQSASARLLVVGCADRTITKIVPTIPAACKPINDGRERPWRKPGATRSVACLPR